jgi:hypothetical protein
MDVVQPDPTHWLLLMFLFLIGFIYGAAVV